MENICLLKYLMAMLGKAIENRIKKCYWGGSF